MSIKNCLFVAWVVVWSLVIASLVVEKFNPLGYGQRIFWGQRPPYRWIQDSPTLYPLGTINERYVGSNGAECASVYHIPGIRDGYTVFGSGFQGEYETQVQAEQVAEHECR